MMTLWEYRTRCLAAGITHPFIDADLEQRYPDVMAAAIISDLEFTIPILRELLEVAGSDEISDLTELHELVTSRSSAEIMMHADEWELRLKSMSALAGLSVSDLGDTWTRSRTSSGQKSGDTSTDGTASRNSFNTSDLVPVSGSHVAAESGESYSDTMTETGTQGRSKEEAITAFLKSIDWNDLISDMADAIVSAIAITVY